MRHTHENGRSYILYTKKSHLPQRVRARDSTPCFKRNGVATRFLTTYRRRLRAFASARKTKKAEATFYILPTDRKLYIKDVIYCHVLDDC